MRSILQEAATTAFVAAAILTSATPSMGDGAAGVVDSGQHDHRYIERDELRIKTDDYLVPAHICADAESEKYEDCIPWSQIGENAILVVPSER